MGTKAYETLHDDDKRSLYDKYGEKGVERGGGGGGDMDDIFSSFFGGGGARRERGPQKGKDVLFNMKATLEDVYNGTSRKLRMSKQVVCKGCMGAGGKGAKKCVSCKGQGVKTVIRQLGPGMIQQMRVACSDCEGKGEIIP